MRILVTARGRLAKAHAGSVKALTALVRSHELGVDAGMKRTGSQIAEVSRCGKEKKKLPLRIARPAAIRLAKHFLDLDQQLAANALQLHELVSVSETAPLLDQAGFKALTASNRLLGLAPSDPNPQ